MLHIELAQHLDDYARGALSDTLTRGMNADAPLTMISVLRSSQTFRPRTRREAKLIATAGTHAFLLDAHTAIALARGGLLMRHPGYNSFAAASAHDIALHRTRHQLMSYLETAKQLVSAHR